MMRQSSTIAASALALALAFGIHSSAAQAPAQPLAKGSAHPYTKQHLYDENADPVALIAAGLKQARAEHKRVILDFGGDWCGDCQVLDIYLHDPANWPIAEKNFVFVHIFIGHMDKNLQLAASYGVPINKGVPALAVLNSNGVLLYSQKTGEFNDMRHMDVASLTDFLNKWKG
jgi:thiol:disulfide interchange protein